MQNPWLQGISNGHQPNAVQKTKQRRPHTQNASPLEQGTSTSLFSNTKHQNQKTVKPMHYGNLILSAGWISLGGLPGKAETT